jgi:hypothetical protein
VHHPPPTVRLIRERDPSLADWAAILFLRGTSREGTMLSDEQLAKLARDCYDEVKARPLLTAVEEGARAALQRLVDDRNVRMRHRPAVRLITRALAVDLSDLKDRKGPIPRALGLVSRGRKGVSLEHQAIVLMMLRVKDAWDEDPKTHDVTFPHRTNEAAAFAVAAGFKLAGINRSLTEEKVLKVRTRLRPSPRQTRR